MSESETAYAKLNLALHVRKRRTDGYHDIETVFAFCEDGDDVTAEAADDLSVTVSGPFARDVPTGDDSLVIQAALALRKRGGVLRWRGALPRSRICRWRRGLAADRPTRGQRCAC